MSCSGCYNRLELPVGTSGRCDPCYLAKKIQTVVSNRYPTAKSRELISYLAQVLTTLESDCELFEADRTAGLVDAQGYLVVKKSGKPRVKKEEKPEEKAGPVSGEHPGHEDPAARPSRSEKEESETTL